MTKVTVGTGAGVKLDLTAYPDKVEKGQTIILSNIGSGDIYFDTLSNVATTSGIKIAAGGSVTLYDVVQDVWVTASAGSTDLRYVVVG